MPATDWKETIVADEDVRLESLAEQLHQLQLKHAKDPGRALHRKGVAGVTAEFRVLPDLPAHARIGLFNQPASYQAYVRFSNGAAKRGSDRRGDARGMAVKIVGVPGRKIIPGMEDAATQDFLGNHAPNIPFRDAAEFVFVVCAADRPATVLFRLIGKFGFARTFRLLKDLARAASVPMTSIATTTYFSASPIAFGPYAVQYRFAACAEADANARAGKSADYLREDLVERLARGPLEYDFRVQFFVDEARTSIESSLTAWAESDSPPVTLARLTIPQQDISSTRGKNVAQYVESLSFDPWHALIVFRPLGNIMRARNHAYRVSTMERKAAAEPDGSEKFE